MIWYVVSDWLGISNYGTISIPDWDNEFNVDLDIGPKGQRGSQIFFGQEKPTTFTEFPEDAPLPYDLY